MAKKIYTPEELDILITNASQEPIPSELREAVIDRMIFTGITRTEADWRLAFFGVLSALFESPASDPYNSDRTTLAIKRAITKKFLAGGDKAEKDKKHISDWGIPKNAEAALAPLPKRNWLVVDLFATGEVSIWFAEPGHYKSMLAYDMGACISGGLPWLPGSPEDLLTAENAKLNNSAKMDEMLTDDPGGWSTVQNTVLALDFDQGADRMQERVGGALRAYGLGKTTPFYYLSFPSPWIRAEDTDQMLELVEYVKELGVKLVVIDTLATTSAHIDENSSQMQDAMINWRRLAEDADCHVLILHHSGKNGIYRGSSAIKAGVDYLIELKINNKVSSRREIVVYCEKARGAPFSAFGARFTCEQDSDRRLSTAQFYAVPITELLDDNAIVFDLVRTHEGNESQGVLETLARDKGISKERFQVALQTMKVEGKIERDKTVKGNKTVWILTAKSMDELENGSA